MTVSWIEWRRLRGANMLGFLACAGLLGGAYYLEFVVGMEPCPLCILQRLAMFALGIVFLLAVVHGPRGRGRFGYAFLILLSAGTGAAIAVRHLWLQSLPPDQVPACGPGLDFMVEAFPLQEVLMMVLEGSGECAEVETLFGVTLPGWTLAAFVIVGLYGFWVNVKPRERLIWA
ncbi:disulfide bond formation protein DsbB [Natronocella acetinitrilica]|uniref:Disulfide bond formation protein B n=1 Tax=Natronocella acetinitrilica TaxID=414046 RepID=A0AAE3KAY7_9GAMM|nr:disulfide bond formation protein B [Natronocella acetinitrilica]MCP1674945.1 disulfide bond formation protein DsbB [Natronocella acetinitrilica]